MIIKLAVNKWTKILASGKLLPEDFTRIHGANIPRSVSQYASGIEKGNSSLAKKFKLKFSKKRVPHDDTEYFVNKTKTIFAHKRINPNLYPEQALENAVGTRHEVYEGMSKLKNRMHFLMENNHIIDANYLPHNSAGVIANEERFISHLPHTKIRYTYQKLRKPENSLIEELTGQPYLHWDKKKQRKISKISDLVTDLDTNTMYSKNINFPER